MAKTKEYQRKYYLTKLKGEREEARTIARAQKYAEKAREESTSVQERVFDVQKGGVYNAMSQISPRKGNTIQPGDTISMRSGLVSDKQRVGWTLDDSSGSKIDLSGRSVKVTNVKKTDKTVTITGEIRVTGRKSTTTRKVKKQFNKNNTIIIEY